jgi:hypothetical protein
MRTSAASGYVCPVDDAAESFIVGVVVAPDDVPADHAGLLPVTGVVGAVEREVAQRRELGLDAVQPGRIRRRIGNLDVVRLRPGSDPGVFGRGQVRAEVVADDRDTGAGRVQRAHVPAELQEPGPGLARLDVPVELVFVQVVGGEQVPDPGGAGVGRAQAGPRGASGFFALATDRGPVPARTGLKVQRPELIDTEHDLSVAGARGHLAVGDRVQALDPGLLRRVARVLGGLPGLYPLKRDALLAEQHPQALMADVIDHPLSHQELRQLRQAPGGKRQVVLGWLGLGDLLDLPPLAEGELRRAAALVLGVQGAEPIGVEVMDHIADPVLAGERHLRDPGHVHPLRRQQHHLRPPPGHHRPTAPAHDPHQPPALIIIDLTHPHTLGHRPSLGDRHGPGKRPPRARSTGCSGRHSMRVSQVSIAGPTRPEEAGER